MPIDILSMTKDPDFLTLSPDDQRQLILTARQQNEGTRPVAPAAPSGAFPWGGGMRVRGVSTPAEAQASVEAMRDRVARGVAEQPRSDLTIDIEKTSPPAPGSTTARLPRDWSAEEWDAALEPMRLELEQGTQGISSLLLPMGGAMAGYKLGAQIAPRLGVVGKVVPAVGEAMGALAGRKANVAMGNEPPGTAGDVAAAALPLALRGTTGAVGSMFERALNLTGTPFLNRLLGRFGSGVSVGVLLHTLMGDPSVASLVGGSVAGLRLFLDGVAATPWGTKVLTSVLATGRQLGGPELSALVQVGRVKLAQKLAQMGQAGQMPDTWDETFPQAPSEAP